MNTILASGGGLWEVRVRATSRWAALCAGRGGGEWVHDRGDTTKNATDVGAVG